MTVLLLSIFVTSFLHEGNGQVEVVDASSADSLYLLADSAFVYGFKLKDRIRINDLEQPSFGENESAYSYLKEKAVYYQIDEFEVVNGRFGRIIYTDFPSLHLDGTMQLFFIATYNADSTEIDNTRLAKYEVHSDVSYLETAEVEGLLIKKKIESTSVADDGSLIEKVTHKAFRINSEGKIDHIPQN
ncbi:MAG: hypothetical protein AAF632_16675 [Bacteroidota bacterium]